MLPVLSSQMSTNGRQQDKSSFRPLAANNISAAFSCPSVRLLPFARFPCAALG
jgi:hypothetical protein